jgi:hypothetical protein
MTHHHHHQHAHGHPRAAIGPSFLRLSAGVRFACAAVAAALLWAVILWAMS